jgi:hypothetical protein
MAWSQEDVDALTEPASLNEKLELIKHIEMIEQEKVQTLKTNLSSEQWVALNIKIEYQARKDLALKQDLEVAEAMGGRAQRRNVICPWVLDPTRGQCDQNVSMGLTLEQEWKQTEHWQGKSAYVPGKWTENESPAPVSLSTRTPLTRRVKKVSKKRELKGRQSEDVLLETDQAAIFAEAMQNVQGFQLDAVGGAMWDADTGKGTGKGASSSSCVAALAITNTMIKCKGKLNEQQKDAKKRKSRADHRQNYNQGH